MRRIILGLMIGIFAMHITGRPTWSMETQVRSGLEDLQVDPHSGSASLSYPIIVPPGRGGVQPNLAIAYNSNNKNGMVGMGWNFEMGSIVRSTQDGIPNFDDTDIFVLNQNGSTQELVYDTSSGRYYSKIESAFLNIKRIGDEWRVTDRSGTVYIFGADAEAREYDPDNSSRILKWCLNRVEDVHGNYMDFSYEKDGNKLYPTQVSYTGHEQQGKLPFARIVFEYDQQRPDVLCSYITGIKLTVNRLLKSVRVYAEVNGTDQLQRRYELIYATSSVTGRSLLRSIEQYGMDDQTMFPATVFSYEDNGDILQKYSDWVSSDNNQVVGNNLWNVRVNASSLFDVNVGPLYPRQSGDPNTGWLNGANVPWGPVHTQPEGTAQGVMWSTNSDGKFNSLSHPVDRHVLASTYIYLSDPRSINFDIENSPFSGASLFVNGALELSVFNQPAGQRSKSIALDAGYHLIELTGYNEDRSSENLELKGNYYTVSNFVNSSNEFRPQYAADFNGDAFIDNASFNVSSGELVVQLSNGGVFQSAEVWKNGINSADQIFTGDFNADGRSDILVFDKSLGDWRVSLSTGNGLNTGAAWITGFGVGEDGSVGDMNGDGLTDIITFYKEGGLWKTRVALNQNNTFEPASQHTYTVGDDTHTPILGNFNGDGLIDFGTFDKANGRWEIKLNTGLISDPLNSLPTVNSFGTNKNTVVTDFNADGLTDLGYYDYVTGLVYCRISSGGGFGSSHPLPFIFNLHSPQTQVQAQDYNGDGMVDWVAYNEIGQLEIAYSQVRVPDLLINVDNGIGAQTDIVYKSSAYQNNTFLPFVVPVIDSVTSRVLNESYQTTYEYSDGWWDAGAREFRGFGMVKVLDPELNYNKSFFHQDDIRQGRLYCQETYSADHRLYARGENTWMHETLASGSDFVYLARKDNFVFDGDEVGRRTAELFSYGESPQYGNLTRATQLGEVDFESGDDIGNDTRIVVTQYTKNINGDHWLLGLPWSTKVIDSNNNVLRETWFHYDYRNDLNTVPSRGLLTKKVDWNDQGDNPQTRYTYDVYGNLQTTNDPKDYTTSITYDSTFQLFPITTTNPIPHSIINTYYGINGEALDDGSGYQGLWGQLKSTTDPNNNSGSRSYDVFGRLEKSVSPLDSISLPSSESVLTCFPDYMQITAKQRINHGSSETIHTVSFIDGMGRAIQSKSPSHQAGQVVVTGQTEYNSRGLPIRQYLPYFKSESMDTIASIDTSRASTLIDYDVMGRVIRTENPDGSYATVEYDDWATYTIDENGHMQSSVFDAYGRLIEKREYTGANGRSEHYSVTTGSVKNHYEEYSVTQYEYDLEGNLVRTIDDYNNTTIIDYNSLGRKVSMNDPDMGIWTYTYDANGNLKSQKDAENQTIYFDYDELNRLTRKYDHDQLNVIYHYDDPADTQSKGRLSSVGYSGGDAKFTYDEVGREIESIKKINSIDYNVKRNYDALNNLIDVEYPDQEKVYYDYNDAGQVESISNDPALFDQGAMNLNSELNDESDNLKMAKLTTAFNQLFEVLERYVLGVKPAYAQTVVDRINFGSSDTTGIPGYKLDVGEVYSASRGYGWNRVPDNMKNYGFDADERRNSGAQVDYWETATWEYDLDNGEYEITLAVGDAWHQHGPHTLYLEGVRVMEDQFGGSGGGDIHDEQTYSVMVTDNKLHIKLGPNESPVNARRISINYIIIRSLSGGGSSNQAPTVDAGSNQTITMPNAVTLVANVSDDNLPMPVNMSTMWSKVSGPGAVTFSNPNNVNSTATFSQTGVYTLRMLADDGALESWDELIVTVNAAPSGGGGDVIDRINFGSTSTPNIPDYRLDTGEDYNESTGYGWSGFRTTKFNGYDPDDRRNSSVVVNYWESATWEYDLPNGDYLVTFAVGDTWHQHGPHTVSIENQIVIEDQYGGDGGGNIFPAIEDVPVSVTDGKLTVKLGPNINPANARAITLNYIIIRLASGAGTTNQAPSVNAGSDQIIDLSDSLSLNAIVSDDGLPIPVNMATTWSKVSGPGAVSFSNSNSITSSATFSQTGMYTLRMLANDGELEGMDELIVTVTSNPVGNGGGVIDRINFGSTNTPNIEHYRLDSGEDYSASTGYGWSGFRTTKYNGYDPDERRNSSVVVNYWESAKWEYDLPNGEYLITFAVGDTWHQHGPHTVSIENQIVIEDQYGGDGGGNIFPAIEDVPVSVTDGKLTVQLGPNLDPINARAININYIIIRSASISGTNNQAPIVNAGTDQTINLSNNANLNAIVSDDGLPSSGNLTTTWSRVSGPGDVTFTNSNTPNTSVSFSAEGTYTLRLTANDGELFAMDDIRVIVNDGTGGGVDSVLFVDNIEYNPAGQITRMEYGNGVVTTHEYDEMFRVTRIFTVDANSNPIQDFKYTYDSVGNILTITDDVNTADQTFTYDELNRLKTADAASYGTKIYTYNTIGNIMQKDGRSYTYGEGNAGPHAVTRVVGGGQPTFTYTYDGNGNMLTKQELGGFFTEYDYDVENRLLKVIKDGTDIAEFLYDGDGGRTQKITNDENIKFIGSLYEVANNRTIRYIYLGATRVAQLATAQVMYYHTDHLGSTNVLTDATGVVKRLMEYKPFGSYSVNAPMNLATEEEQAYYAFTSQYHDKESELYYYNARYYDPELGRFITSDLTVQRASNPVTLNRYCYTGNNPINNTDPSGYGFFGFLKNIFKSFFNFQIPGLGDVITGGSFTSGQTVLQKVGSIATTAVSAYTLGLSPGFQAGTGFTLVKASAAVTLTSQVADAADQDGLAQGLRYASTALSAVYAGLNVGIGIKDWTSSKLSVMDLMGNTTTIQSGDNVFVNGILTESQGALNQAAKFNQAGAQINVVAHNPTSGFIADLTESFLQKITFTSSVDRQLASLVKGLNSITFTAHSQGTFITGNALLNLGFSDNRNVVTNSVNFSSPLSQPRAAISAAIGGTGNSRFIYSNNWGDPINLIGPNINPAKFLSGMSLQFQNH